jgi:hypothetical protein
MATSLQSPHAVILVIATLSVLFIGSAHAWQCPSGFKDCNPHKPGCDTCIKNDVYNCGDCGKKCKLHLPYTTAKCENFKCVYTCKTGWADCDNNKYSNGCETDIGNDPRNCGKCGKCCKQVPNAITKCKNGDCKKPTCKHGWGDCDCNIWSNGCEKDLSKDIYNCGKCGHKCEVTLKGGEATCKHGHCGQQCKKGTKFDEHKKCCVPIH